MSSSRSDDDLSWAQRLKISEQVVEMERKLTNAEFNLSFVKDDGALVSDLRFWDDEKSELDHDRGPWPDTLSYLLALVKRSTYHRDQSSFIAIYVGQFFIEPLSAAITSVIDSQMQHQCRSSFDHEHPSILQSRLSIHKPTPDCDVPTSFEHMSDEYEAEELAKKEKAKLQNAYLRLTKERNPTLFEGSRF
ncbi:hypothetical protein BT69DRAFT_1296554 [Atractiella rhizophila]|nr:hypothetical protein BT69DRAFT_1296554 [Atractiella rhizophila]